MIERCAFLRSFSLRWRSRRAAARTRISSTSSGRHRSARAIATIHSSTGSRIAPQRAREPRQRRGDGPEPRRPPHERRRQHQHDGQREEPSGVGERAQAERQRPEVHDRRRRRQCVDEQPEREQEVEGSREARERAERYPREEDPDRDDARDHQERQPRRRDGAHERELGDDDQLRSRPQPVHRRLARHEPQERQLGRSALRSRLGSGAHGTFPLVTS